MNDDEKAGIVRQFLRKLNSDQDISESLKSIKYEIHTLRNDHKETVLLLEKCQDTLRRFHQDQNEFKQLREYLPLQTESIVNELKKVLQERCSPTPRWYQPSIQTVSLVLGGLFFLYKLMAGAMMAGASLQLTAKKFGPETHFNGTDTDIYSAQIKINRNENWAIRLLGARLDVKNCINQAGPLYGEELKNASVYRTMDFWPLDNRSLREPNVGILSNNIIPEPIWRPRKPVGEDGSIPKKYWLDQDIRYAMSPGEVGMFAVFVQVPRHAACILEVTVVYNQFNWIDTGSVLMASIPIGEEITSFSITSNN